MKTIEFDYHLPQSMIAQKPSDYRSESKLMILDRKTDHIKQSQFSNILEILKDGDVLVLNNSKVIPVRLNVNPINSPEKNYEIFLLNQSSKNNEPEKEIWDALICPGKKMKPGSEFVISGKNVHLKILENAEFGGRLVEVIYPDSYSDIYEMLQDCGNVPLPPYIKDNIEDIDRYQTVFAKLPGSVAAPTAGLHFTDEILDKLKNKGVEIFFITLHVGLGTFRPVKCEDIKEHKMESERYYIDSDTAENMRLRKKTGARFISCGTTTTRVLESIEKLLNGDDVIDHAVDGETDIFIYPGYEFKVVDALITNFHLSESTLLMLVSAFAGRENIMNAYQHAIDEGYRFFSYGDAMF
ncbi:tRNA preQ1(34) S-adenosylmethionine ribosyltransferase-isomerase QueA, partial [bacterium]|nr:tRNA preQ1(34) S-adenosylmethionine ribosyltransferase-isomerase QueA [bacterium]